MEARDVNKIVVALAKGRLAEGAVNIFSRVGIDCKAILEPSRKLVLELDNSPFSFIFVKPSDVPIYVEYGIADIGVCGRDTLLEENKSIYELIDLKFAKCSICLAGFPSTVIDKKSSNLKVATKYTSLCQRLFNARGQNVEIISLNGSIELAPILGLSDIILDVVESGKTLKENNLVVLEKLYDSSAVLVSNKVSLKTKPEIVKIKDKIEKLLKE